MVKKEKSERLPTYLGIFWWSVSLPTRNVSTIINQYLLTYLPTYRPLRTTLQVHRRGVPQGRGFWSGGGYDAKMTTKCIHYWREVECLRYG